MGNLGDRTKYIGGSDIPSIMGLSPYKSRLKLLREKKGIDPCDFSGNKYTDFGSEKERVVIECAEMDLGININSYPDDDATIESEVNGFPIICHIDGDTDWQGGMIVEAKTASTKKFDVEWKDGVPSYYVPQVQAYMHFDKMGRKRALVIVAERTEEFELGRIKSFVVDYDPVFCSNMESDISLFVDELVSEDVILPDNILDELAECESKMKDAKDKVDHIKLLIKDRLGDKVHGVSEKWIVSKQQIKSMRFSSSKLKKDNAELYEKYKEESVSERLSVKRRDDS